MMPDREAIKTAEQLFRTRDKFEKALDAITGYPPGPTSIEIGYDYSFDIPVEMAEKFLSSEIERVNSEIRELGVQP